MVSLTANSAKYILQFPQTHPRACYALGSNSTAGPHSYRRKKKKYNVSFRPTGASLAAQQKPQSRRTHIPRRGRDRGKPSSIRLTACAVGCSRKLRGEPEELCAEQRTRWSQVADRGGRTGGRREKSDRQKIAIGTGEKESSQ